MRHSALLFLLMIGATALFGAPSPYGIKAPTIPLLSDSPTATVAPVQAGVVAPADDEHPKGDLTQLDGAVYGLKGASLGFPYDHSSPQYYLGDILPAPVADNLIDWKAMWEYLSTATITDKDGNSIPRLDNQYILDKEENKIYVIAGGSIELEWKLKNGTTTTIVYQVSSVTSGRPMRIYWTNEPYNSPTVDFTGETVKLFGVDEPVYEVTEYNDFELSREVVHGIYVQDNILHVVQGDLNKYPPLSGQFVVAYYESGLYKHILGVVVVEINAPNPIDMKGVIGSPLEAHGGGHPTEGLLPFPLLITPTDNRGEYYYQHQGQYSYSPKHLNVYPLRPTEAANTRVQVWWKEYDDFDTLWPYEHCRYTCDWGDNVKTFVRAPMGQAAGLPLTFDENMTLELQGYQEPNGHALAVENDTFSFTTTIQSYTTPHRCLLKITGEDNIWFLPLQSVASNDTSIFTQTAADWTVGDELRPRGGSVSGIVQKEDPKTGEMKPVYTPEIAYEVSGYLYAPTSGRNYNTDLYYPKEISATGAATQHDFPSALFPVNVDPEKDLEVWWSSRFQEEDMPGVIEFPTLAQKYKARWPKSDEVSTIVLASQLGSAQEHYYSQGKALYLDGATTQIKLPPTRFFRQDTGSVGFWLRAPATANGRLLTLGDKANAGPKLTVDLENGALKVSYGIPSETATCTVADVATGEWAFVGITMEARKLSVNVNGVVTEAQTQYTIDESSLVVMDASSLGQTTDGAVGAPAGVEMDTVSIWRQRMTIEDLKNPATAIQGLMLHLAFDGTNDLEASTNKTTRTAYEAATRTSLTVVNGLASVPGAPTLSNGVITADTMPTVYAQNDASKPGYNPNEEHALVTESNGGYTVWALRDDLNTETSSRPCVLVTYVVDGKPKMRAYHVVRYDETYPALAGAKIAGTQLAPPHPIDYLPDYWNTKNTWRVLDEPPFRDRKKQIWAICGDKTATMQYYYPVQEGFAFPDGSKHEIGEYIPWLDGEGTPYTFDDKPADWVWNVTWPEDVPEMKVGQTLTTAINGLPEVWGAKSMGVLYPKTGTDKAGTKGAHTKRVRLYDPTVMQTGSLAASGCKTTQDFITKAGLTLGDTGNAEYRNGVYTLRNLPPSLNTRFTIDPTRPIESAIGLIGEKEDNAASTSLLYLNVLTDTERNALKNFFTFSDTTLQNAWNNAIQNLAKDVVEPNTYTLKKPSNGTHIAIQYNPVDHYAMTAVGGEVGYVTLIENDSTNTDIVKEGDPISVHIVKVIPELYVAPLAVREDPNNMLSEQLSIIYGEAFAGKSSDYEFEWRTRLPQSSGIIPTDMDNWNATTPDAGKTDLVVGGKNSTLETMVNTYHAVRYRAKEGTTAYTTTQGKWSDWSGPTLAEGWVQRVLNNITPFTQTMPDLYTNKAETVTSMIEKAGAPYQGNIALNQNNLPNVGLIQLYLTVMDRAEALSIANGPTLEAANEQLLLAATRTADLYALLGDEAYTDALNPTIGFGGSYTTANGIEYGNLHTSALFCFDNQVPTLLDEELALLRGRDADYGATAYNGENLRVAPYYHRLPWNMTRDLKGGEVAYAVNYNISGTKSSLVDVEEAAKLYPQGHGDAYGHYLSAVKLYYRLLRNPNFSWGTPGMGEMLLGDTVLNVDYYDEERFAEIANKMAEVARATFDRTARKAYAENGGVAGGGYLDAITNRGFGYGEWAAKAAQSTFYNWAVANSLLPESENTAHYSQLTFTEGNETDGLSVELQEYCATAITMDDNTQQKLPFTAEFQVTLNGEQGQHTQPNTLFKWTDGKASIALMLNGWQLSLHTKVDATSEEKVVPVTTLTAAERYIVALGRKGATVTTPEGSSLLQPAGAINLRLLTTVGTPVATVDLEDDIVLSGGNLSLGGGAVGLIEEIRFWASDYREDQELIDHYATITEAPESLYHYVRTYTPEDHPTALTDICAELCQWTLSGATWKDYDTIAAELPYTNKSLTRIDRAAASGLNLMPDEMKQIYETLERLDAGQNPLGFSDSALPFDVSPIGMEDGSSSHFEQVLARAEIALKNANAMLTNAQTLGSRLRQIADAQYEIENRLDEQELVYENDLIGYYGTPYSDDIGPSGLYVQGYTGPDYYHYMYMDLTEFGIASADDLKNATTNKTWTVTHNYTLTTQDYHFLAELNKKFAITNGCKTITLPYEVSPDGFVMKPSSFKGSRSAIGSLQQAYADALVAYIAYEEAVANVDRYNGKLTATVDELNTVYAMKRDYFLTWETLSGIKYAATDVLTALGTFMHMADTTQQIAQTGVDGIRLPWVVGGVAVGSDVPDVIRQNAANLIMDPLQITSIASNETYQTVKNALDLLFEGFDQVLALYKNDLDLADTLLSMRSSLFGAINNYYDAVVAARTAGATYTAAIQKFSTLRSEAEGHRAERELMRQQATNALTRLRYNDMFFRQVRNEALARYERAFEIAQQYVYLAAQSYGYETVASMDELRAKIVGARTIGILNDGEPQATGDGSLADILATLKADWSVAKGRFGINNPYTTMIWVSLRNELLRIRTSEDGDAAWRKALQRYVVEDLRKDSRYRRYCQPIMAQGDTPEPALVIPFETSSEFAKNLFGRDVAGGDSFIPTGYHATRIARVGVRFQGYDPTGSDSVFSMSPSVWLIPTGADYFRRPGATSYTDVSKFSVVDQVIPLPYDVGNTGLNAKDWQPLYDGDMGGANAATRIRRHPSFTATYGDETKLELEFYDTIDIILNYKRLIGRSVWNDQWVLIIPFATMNADRETAMKHFIYGDGTNRGVTDISIGLQTYSHSGN